MQGMYKNTMLIKPTSKTYQPHKAPFKPSSFWLVNMAN